MKDYINKIYPTNNSCDVKVIEYRGCMDVDVIFLDENGGVVNSQISHIKDGKVKNPYKPSLYNIGYVGSGVYKSRINKVMTREYSTWSGMFNRCYGGRHRYASYIDTYVVKEWHNFQIFAEWFTNIIYDIDEQIDLDKDILDCGYYGPNSCLLIPSRLNQAARGDRILEVLNEYDGVIPDRIKSLVKNKYFDNGASAPHVSRAPSSKKRVVCG